MREKRIFLTLDELTIVASQSGIFTLSNFVQGLGQVPYDMELIVENGRLWCFLVCGFLKWFPFHMSITASRICLVLAGPTHS